MGQNVSIKKNFFYSSFLTTANYLFTFITYPYVSRVLGVDKIGTVNFVDSVINYFILLSMMGVSIVGIREVAKAKKDARELRSAYSSILTINVFLTVVVLLILGTVYLFVPQLNQHGDLMLFGAFKLVANVFLLDWVVKGLEDFRMVTLRTFAVRTCYVIAVFIFVRDASDYRIYYGLIVLSVLLNAVFNLAYLRKRVSFSLANLEIRSYLSPIFMLGLYMVFCSFYNSLNIMALGIFAGETEVGYYTTATKLFNILLSLISAFCGVMLPRMSSLLSEGKEEEYKRLLDKSVVVLYIVCVPMVMFSEVHAANIVNLISGEGYEGAVLPMRICIPLLLIIGHSNILLHQGLMPLSKDKAIFVVSGIGALIAVSSMFYLIPNYQSTGSAILWICSEFGVNVAAACFMYKYIKVGYPGGKLLKAIVTHIPLLFLLYATAGCIPNFVVNLMAGGAITVLYCIILQCYILKDATIRGLLRLKN